MVGTAWIIWSQLTPDQRELMAGLWTQQAGLIILAVLALLLLLVVFVKWLADGYINPLCALAEEIRVVAMSNPRHRLALLLDVARCVAGCPVRLLQNYSSSFVRSSPLICVSLITYGMSPSACSVLSFAYAYNTSPLTTATGSPTVM